MDPGYLAVADPARLVTVLPFIQDERARRFSDIYNRVADRLIDHLVDGHAVVVSGSEDRSIRLLGPPWGVLRTV